mgnify:CR=1 FL=1
MTSRPRVPPSILAHGPDSSAARDEATALQANDKTAKAAGRALEPRDVAASIARARASGAKVRLGVSVDAIEQTEDAAAARARGNKSVVRRDVVRLVTPGTLTEERLLEPGRARLLVAIQKVRSAEGRPIYGLAALDLSTGTVALNDLIGQTVSSYAPTRPQAPVPDCRGGGARPAGGERKPQHPAIEIKRPLQVCDF